MRSHINLNSLAFGQPTLDSVESERNIVPYSNPSSQSFNSRTARTDRNVLQSKDDINISLDPGPAARTGEGGRNKVRDGGFSVKHLHQERDDVQGEDLQELKSQLETVTQEKNELLRNQERVNAQWEGRVRRLERQLQAQDKGEKPAEVRQVYKLIT